MRGQLAAVLAVLVIPMIVLQSLWGYGRYEDATERARLEALALADATRVGIRQFLAVAEAVLSELASRYRPELGGGEACDVIHSVGAAFPIFTTVGTTDKEGNVVCSTLPVPSDLSAAQREGFVAVREGRGFKVGDPVSGSVTLPLFYPLLDARGEFVGALFGSVPLLAFQDILADVVWDRDHLVTIVTGERIVVARSAASDEWVGHLLPPANGVDREVEPRRALSEGPDIEGVEGAWGRVDVPGIGWTVYAGTPSTLGAGGSSSSAMRRIGLSALVLALGVLMAMRFAQDILQALRHLTEGVEAAHTGKHIDLPPYTPTEVCAVVEQFNLVVDRFDETLRARARAEAAERKVREQYQSIFDNAVFGVYVSTFDGRFIQVNAAMVEMLAYDSPEALLAAGPAALYPDSSLRLALMDEYLDRGVIKDLPLVWVRADGKPINVRLNGKVVQTEDGQTAFEMIVEDVTEAVRKEEELRHTQRMEAVGKFTGGIAHDFNNLLTVISGNLEFALEGLSPDHPNRKEVAQADAAAIRATKLISQLMSFSRKKSAPEEVADLNEIVGGMKEMLGRLAGGHVTVDTRLAPNPPLSVRADRGQIEQILMNLVANARDALTNGGRITLETAWGARKRGGHLVQGLSLRVTDTGHGMSAETRARVFEPFFTTKPEGMGTGLGLATAYQIMQEAGGTIEVTSEAGEGACFELWFPSPSERVEDVEETALLSSAPLGGNETVLLVEDEELSALLACRALERLGYGVIVASEAEEALGMFDDSKGAVDLVVADVRLLRREGAHLLEGIRCRNPKTPILFVSADVSPTTDGTPSHLDGVLPKPYHPVELCAQVRQLLDQRPDDMRAGSAES